MVRRAVVGRAMLVVGAVGVAVSILGSIVGLALLTELDRALEGSVHLTAEAVDALGSSVGLAEDTVVVLQRSLEQTESTTRDLVTAFEDAERILGATADLSENQVAASLGAVERALPALVDVAAVIDRTLSAVSAVPFAPDYAPPEPFDESLRTLQREMAGLPADLRAQAELMREGSDSLGDVRASTEAIAVEMGALHATLDSALGVLRGYSATATEAGDLVSDSDSRLDRQLTVSRVLVVVLGATLLAGQVVPLGIGWFLLRPQAAAAFFAASP